MKILFLSLTFEDIGVAMVANMINQLQESFPLRRAAGSFDSIASNPDRKLHYFLPPKNYCIITSEDNATLQIQSCADVSSFLYKV